MVSNKYRLIAKALMLTFSAAALQATPAIAQSTNECSTYSIRVCQPGVWEAWGYTSQKECRLQEYANCMAGVPPVDSVAYKPETQAGKLPASATAAHQRSRV